MNSVREAKLTDREKVVEKLQAIDAYFRESFNAMDGTLACEQFREWSNAVEDAIAMLKAQESMRARLGIIHFGDGSKSYFLHCPFDGATLDEDDNYCRRCGRAVKW